MLGHPSAIQLFPWHSKKEDRSFVSNDRNVARATIIATKKHALKQANYCDLSGILLPANQFPNKKERGTKKMNRYERAKDLNQSGVFACPVEMTSNRRKERTWIREKFKADSSLRQRRRNVWPRAKHGSSAELN